MSTSQAHGGEDAQWEYAAAAPCPECGQPGPGSFEWDDYDEFLEAMTPPFGGPSREGEHG